MSMEQVFEFFDGKNLVFGDCIIEMDHIIKVFSKLPRGSLDFL